MEFILRCNELKCRAQLHEQAVATTCSHVFCTRCADSSGLSLANNANRQCPACGTNLMNPDDVVVAGLNPSEDYKTSVLSGLSPTIIMECASRGLSFYTYQSSQEIIYQEHLAKSLTEKYTVLSQQMDQLIHDANAQIKALQDKLQSMQAEQATLEQKNHELIKAFGEKSKAQQQQQKLYQALKAQVMASHVANAAGDEADFTLHTARADKFVDRLPGTRTGTANYNQPGAPIRQGRQRYGRREGSGSSGSGGQPQGGGVGLGPTYNPQLHGHGLNARGYTGQSAPVGMGTPHGQPRSRLPVLGGTRSNAFLNADSGPTYQPSASKPLDRDPRTFGNFGYGPKASKRR